MTPRSGPGRFGALGEALGGALCGGSAAGALEALRVLVAGHPTEYGALAWGAIAYGAAAVPIGLAVGLVCALVRPGRARGWAWALGFAGAALGLGGFVVAAGSGAERPDMRALVSPLAGLLLVACGASWLLGRLLARTPLGSIASLRGTVLVWAGGVSLCLLFSASPAPGAEAGPPAEVPDASPHRPDLLLVAIDGLRSDAISTALTPTLAAFASDAVAFDTHIAAAVEEAPALAALLTGALPSVNGVRAAGDTLDGAAPTLAGALRDGGYVTLGLPATAAVSAARGFGAGFDRFSLVRSDPLGASESATALALYRSARHVWEQHSAQPPVAAFHAPADVQLDQARALLEEARDRPTFLFLELAEPALPWFSADGTAVGLDGVVAQQDAAELYAVELQRLDAALGTFLERLRASGRYDAMAIVVVGIRGVGLGDEGAGAGPLGDARIHVPLLVKLPGGARAGTRVPWQVRAIDVAPTLLHVADLAPPVPWRGATLFDDWFEDDLARLVPPLRDADDPPVAFTAPDWIVHPGSRPALSEHLAPRRWTLGVRSGGRKVVRERGGIVPRATCIDLTLAPDERVALPEPDTACRRADIADELLAGWIPERPPPTPVDPADAANAEE